MRIYEIVKQIQAVLVICSVVVLEESPHPLGPIYKSLSLNLQFLSLSLSP